jgi:hypothetical protein
LLTARDKAAPQDLKELKEYRRYLDKEKVRILNDYIFPSMATLLFFFKCVANYPELRSIFENDIKDFAEDKTPPRRTIEFDTDHLKEDVDRPSWRKLKRNETRIGLSDFE